MKDGQPDHKPLSYILLSTFGCYEQAENMKNNPQKEFRPLTKGLQVYPRQL